MVALDREGRIAGANSRLAGLLGYEPGELAGTDGFALVDPRDRGLARALLQQVQGDGGLSLTASLLRKDGSRVRSHSFWSSASEPPRPPLSVGLFVEVPGDEPSSAAPGEGAPPGLPVTGGKDRPFPTGPPEGGPTGSARRNQVIHTIIFHDAKNRLGALRGYATLLRERLPETGFLPYVDRLEELASDIERDLGMAAIFSHVGLIAPGWQNLRDVVLRSAAREPHGLVIMETLPASLWCFADPLLSRVFSNLFENSRRHGEKVTGIRIGTHEVETGIVISVEDDGIGIPADQKERIFEHGFGRHTGYGLYLAREILATVGFSIRETGDFGKGARFDILIPRGRYVHCPYCPEEGGVHQNPTWSDPPSGGVRPGEGSRT